MKKLAWFVLILLFVSATVSTYAQQYGQDDHDGAYGQRYDHGRDHSRDSGPYPRDGACFYMTAPFRGHSFCLRVGERMPRLRGDFKNNISSIEIFGDARVRIFNDSDYRNGSREVWRTVPDLRDLRFRGGHTWNNRVSSIIVSPGGGEASGRAQPYRRDHQDRGYDRHYDRRRENSLNNRPHPRDGACFDTTAPFRGHRFCLRAGERMAELHGDFDDNISSIEVFGHARVRIFNDSHYRNGSREVWRTVPDLRDLRFRGGHTWNNRISSIMVY